MHISFILVCVWLFVFSFFKDSEAVEYITKLGSNLTAWGISLNQFSKMETGIFFKKKKTIPKICYKDLTGFLSRKYLNLSTFCIW